MSDDDDYDDYSCVPDDAEEITEGLWLLENTEVQ